GVAELSWLAAASALARSRQPKTTVAPRTASTLAASRPMPVLAPVTRAVFPCWSGTSATVHRLLVASRLFMANSLSTLRTVRSRSISIRPIIGTSVPVHADYTGRPSRLSIEPWSVDQTDEGPIRHRRIVRRLRWSRWAAVARRRAAQQEARSGGGRRRV